MEDIDKKQETMARFERLLELNPIEEIEKELDKIEHDFYFHLSKYRATLIKAAKVKSADLLQAEIASLLARQEKDKHLENK